jgi:3'-phosphoadenosine 5'-phosphosulfate sulfotransferase (PAPS reductase)/FAD synthetase
MWKTEGLKQALDKYGFDAAFGGARRDEEKSRAKERIFSFRTASHGWDPKNQRPSCGTSTTPARTRANHPRVPDLELDRAGRLAIHPPQRHPDRAALFRGRARRWSATACC